MDSSGFREILERRNGPLRELFYLLRRRQALDYYIPSMEDEGEEDVEMQDFLDRFDIRKQYVAV
jgi:hypothetical protein